MYSLWKKNRPNKRACADGTGPRETRETIVIVNAVESRGAHTGTETSPPMENTAPTRTYVWDQDIRTEGGRKTREGGKREKRRGATNMLQDVAPEQKTPKRKKKKKKPLHFPCLCSAGASSRLAGWLAGGGGGGSTAASSRTQESL